MDAALGHMARHVAAGLLAARAERTGEIVQPRVVPGGLGVSQKPQAEHELIRSEEHTSELQSLMRISYAVFCLKKKKKQEIHVEHHSKKKKTTSAEHIH